MGKVKSRDSTSRSGSTSLRRRLAMSSSTAGVAARRYDDNIVIKKRLRAARLRSRLAVGKSVMHSGDDCAKVLARRGLRLCAIHPAVDREGYGAGSVFFVEEA